MAGLIKIDNERSWSTAGWAFDHVLRLTRHHLPKEGANILHLIDGIVPGLDYLTLDKLSPAEKTIFRHALEAAYLEAKKAGPKSFSEPSFYPGFMQRFEELLIMLLKDERSDT